MWETATDAADAADEAAQAANTAATAANGAAGKANTAASAANTAAGKADTAATKATDAATEATDAAGDATRAAQSANAAAEAASAAAEAARGNVLKGTLGPAPVLSADDAYATKPRRLTVYGATRQNLWVNPSGTSNGLTVTSNGDGSMTLSGTATSAASVSSADSYIIKPSTAYTLSMNAALTGASFVVTEYDADGSQLAQHSVSSKSAASFTSSASVARCVMSLSVQSGQAVSGTYRVMLNEGSEAQPWCPPGLNSIDELSVVTAGKNLLSRANYSVTRYGVSVTTNTDGSVTLSGTSTASSAFGIGNIPLGFALAPGTYTLSTVDGDAYVQLNDGEGGALIAGSGNKTVTIDRPYPNAYWFIGVNPTFSGTLTVYPQLELGSTATAYEPPNVTTTPIDLDGHTLNSLPDGTCDELHIDGGGAVTLTKRVGVSVIDGTEPHLEYTASPPSRIGAPGLAPGVRSNASNNSNRCDTLPCMDISSGPNAIATYVSGYADIRCEQQITSLETGKAWLAANHMTLLYPLAEPQTISLGTITPPTMAAPNVTAYVADDTPAEMALDYVRDVNIVIDNLAKQIAGTAATVAINEATR